MKKVLLVASLFMFFTTYSQKEDSKVEVKPYGFVKTDAFWDSRQTVTAREGHLLLWPAAEYNDRDGEDINAQPNHNILAIQTRLGIKLSGPEAFGAKASGVIEGAFFGHSNSDVNGFRLRHAYAQLSFPNTELLAGQYWNPFFVTGCFPSTISFNTGIPFQPFARNPQLRITHHMGNLSIILAAAAQRDFTSPGGSASLRNTMAPDSYLQFQYGTSDNEAGKEFLTGVGVEYKVLRPRLMSDSIYKVDETVNSYAFQGFVKVKIPAVTFKLEGVYGQNLYDLLMISSYAVTDVNDVNEERTYTPLNNYSVWAEIHTNGKIQAGLFAGYTENLGSNEQILDMNKYAAGTRSNIENVWRVSPRASISSGKVKIAAEFEVTGAAFGNVNLETGKVDNSTSVTNYRLLLSGIYSF